MAKQDKEDRPSVALYWDFENLHASLCEDREPGAYARPDNRFKLQEPLVDVQAVVDDLRVRGLQLHLDRLARSAADPPPAGAARPARKNPAPAPAGRSCAPTPRSAAAPTRGCARLRTSRR